MYPNVSIFACLLILLLHANALSNSACNLLGHTAVNFVSSFFHSGVRFAGIVGPVCSDSEDYVSRVTSQESVSILNFHTATSPKFTDRSTYRYSFGTVGSSYSTVFLALHLMKENNWESVAVLYEENKFVFLTAYNLLVQELPRVFPQGRIAFSAPVSGVSFPLSTIIDKHLRVIVVLSTWTVVHKMMCLIRRRYHQLTFPTYQFVLAGVRYSYFNHPTSFTLNHRHYVCSVEDITQVMKGFLLTHLQLAGDGVTEMVSGGTYAEYFRKYQARVNGSTTEWANPVYDAVWSLALALNSSIPRLNEIGVDLSNYTYGQKKATDIILKEVVKLSFEGASGHVSFHKKNGYTSATVSLEQVVNNASVVIGYYDEDKKQLLIVGDSEFVESFFKSHKLVVHPALASIFVLITAIALSLIICVHTLTLVYRSFPVVRASSYRLGQLAFVGCYILIVSYLCFTVQKVAPTTSVSMASLCAVQAWCLPLGLTLILGTLTAKTWRLYHIFVQLKKPGIFLQDTALVIKVLALAAVDVIVCSVWTGMFEFTTSDLERITHDNVIEVKVQCYSESYYAWFGALSLYQGLIMVSALVLALLTKNIHRDMFKTKSVILLVYFLTITLFLGFPLYMSLNVAHVSSVNSEYAVLSLTYLTVVFLCLTFMFFPPILLLLRMKLFQKLPGLRKYSKNARAKSNYPSPFILQGKY